MTSFLFWNVMNNDLRAVIARAVVERDVDILLLAESPVPDGDMVSALRAATGHDYWALSQDTDKVRLFTRIDASRWRRRQTDALSARMAIWSVAVGSHPAGILVAAAHFVSKNNESPGGQALLAAELSKEISRVEDAVGHERTVLVGDLNMNPFEEGVTGAPALHAVMTRKLAGRGERTVQGKAYRFFYNPMWGCWGDRTSGPPGSYYHRAATVGDLFWHLFDQVLLRPALMHTLHDLVIMDNVQGDSLLTHPAGLPHASTFSDHLPLAFRLQLS
jgi:endonuclease/exonuclease/phosphatase family metal-dependent hydrolase